MSDILRAGQRVVVTGEHRHRGRWGTVRQVLARGYDVRLDGDGALSVWVPGDHLAVPAGSDAPPAWPRVAAGREARR